MSKAYFLNGMGVDVVVSLNNGAQALAALDLDNPSMNQAHAYDIVVGKKPGADQFGSDNILQVVSSGTPIYTVSIHIDTNTRPLTEDFQFVVYADGVTGRCGSAFSGITITPS